MKFVIVGAARTGSTLLVRTLNSLPGICCHGELLGPQQVRGLEDDFEPGQATPEEREARMTALLREREADPVAFIWRALSRGSAACGFKALYSAFLDPHWAMVTESLLAPGNLRFVHLRRDNGLRRYVSEQILRAGGPNHSAAGGRSEQRIQVHIDSDDFHRAQREVSAQAAQVDTLLAGQAVLPLTYEALAADTSQSIANVCRFLDIPVPDASIQPALAKVGAADLRETVSNYDELSQDPAIRELLTRA